MKLIIQKFQQQLNDNLVNLNFFHTLLTEPHPQQYVPGYSSSGPTILLVLVRMAVYEGTVKTKPILITSVLHKPMADFNYHKYSSQSQKLLKLAFISVCQQGCHSVNETSAKQD
ncbi:unnamed protein product (macronuclear) [Paramecium tetraurelia]|uniref:Uncharacterized protein n=1 Tax=Paramecium tetraurelia TaxID=5888 RepID=A0BFC4_PARTE|nr:uncharacterized protein GSPATT00028276001 [Paramecium tetraurelia]CAK57241.1 unnamed protein product [Paramecium tetraurelia]|eukprot:XP_001424639.1 hypothetical protein (macronuclear) [Paramecium tetraurelia strain d4-2]